MTPSSSWKTYSPSRSRHHAARARSTRGEIRLHRAFDQHLADRGLYSAVADDGIVGRLFHEFAITVIAAILVSGVVSLTLTPMFGSRFLVSEHGREHGRLYLVIEPGIRRAVGQLSPRARLVLQAPVRHLAGVPGDACRHRVLFVSIPKGFFPTQDTGLILGISEAGQDVSPTKMIAIQRQFPR